MMFDGSIYYLTSILTGMYYVEQDARKAADDFPLPLLTLLSVVSSLLKVVYFSRVSLL